jgi:hypothetical protein
LSPSPSTTWTSRVFQSHVPSALPVTMWRAVKHFVTRHIVTCHIPLTLYRPRWIQVSQNSIQRHGKDKRWCRTDSHWGFPFRHPKETAGSENLIGPETEIYILTSVSRTTLPLHSLESHSLAVHGGLWPLNVSTRCPCPTQNLSHSAKQWEK